MFQLINFFFQIKGYGHSTPKTDGGKIFTIIYALIGIPVGLIMFNSIGERFNFFSSLCINKIRKMVKAKQQEATELDLIFVGSTLSCIVVTLGTAAFSHYEGNTICSTTIIVMSKGMPCTVPTIAPTTEFFFEIPACKRGNPKWENSKYIC